MATCKSGGRGTASQDSIAYKVCNEGAQMVVGWYSDFSTKSGPSWLNNYHDSLSKGATVSEAIDYASGKIYLYNDVKNTHLIYYDAISALSNEEISQITNNTNASKKEPSEINVLSLAESNVLDVSNVETVLKKYDSNFDENNYEKIVSEGMYITEVTSGETRKGDSYVDYILKKGDFLTNSGYSVVLNENNKIKAIKDNTIKSEKAKSEEKTAISNNSELNFKVSQEEKDYYLNKAKKEADMNDKIESEEIKFYYDLENDKKYAYVTVHLDGSDVDANIRTYSYEM